MLEPAASLRPAGSHPADAHPAGSHPAGRRTVVLTGASAGIGAAAARRLGRDPHTRLILLGRDPGRTAAVARDAGAEHLLADFTDLTQVRSVAEELLDRCAGRLDVLALNAAAIHRRPHRSVDGFDATLQVNHLAGALLTELLDEPLRACGAAVVVTGSRAERHADLAAPLDARQLQGHHHWCPHHAYANSKLATVLFARALVRHRPGLRTVSFHPGVIDTGLAAGLDPYHRFLYRSAGLVSPTTLDDGADALVHFITGVPGRAWQSGVHYGPDRRRMRLSARAADEHLAEAHWRLTRELLGLPQDAAAQDEPARPLTAA